MKANNGDAKAAEIIVKSWRALATVFAEAHDEHKKEALRQAAVSVPLATGKGDAAGVEHDLFMKLVRQFDGIHIRLLKNARYIKDARKVVESIDGHQGARLALEGRDPFTPKPAFKAWKDLYEAGLVNTDSITTMMTEDGYQQDNRTDVGRRFLSFIADSSAD